MHSCAGLERLPKKAVERTGRWKEVCLGSEVALDGRGTKDILLLKEMFGSCFTEAKQLWRASHGLLGEHCGSAPLGLHSLVFTMVREEEPGAAVV